MKITILIIAGLFILNIVSEAQYNVNKKKYNTKTYHFEPGDPYNPAVMGFASFVLPGLGQILEDETVRGCCFLGVLVGLNIIKYSYLFWPESGSVNNQNKIMAVRYMKVGIHIWSLFDAVHVAKVNNMVIRDQGKTTFDFQLLPYTGSYEYYSMNNEIPVGLTLLINF
jgi:hypothetical protein